jgi:glycosyltransferase involved in cell wall biosynthesis
MKADDIEQNSQKERLKSSGFRRSSSKPSLIIGFDGKRAAKNFTGLGNYSRYVLNILNKFYPDNAYRVYIPGKLDRRADDLAKLSSMRICHPKNIKFQIFWRSFGILRNLKADGIKIFHGLSNEIPFGIKKTGIASVVTIHDLIFLRYPEYYPWLDRKIYNFKFRYACRNADKIIAISEQTKFDIINYYHIPESRIEVIYQNCNAAFQKEISKGELEEVKKRYLLPAAFLLNVGTIESRKNLLLIVKALNDLPAHICLVVIGKETPYSKKVKDYIALQNLTDRVQFLKNVPIEDLPAIYRQAEIFIYPSEFEGFGIPILEALHSQIPVIAAKGSCLEEAGGPESLYVNPHDQQELAAAINSLLNNPGKKQLMIEAGKEYLKKFSDHIIAGKLMELYQKLSLNA